MTTRFYDGDHACVCDREGENTPSASQNGPQDARSADSGTDGPPEPQNAVQGRIGWLRMLPDDEYLYLVQEVPGGWADPNRDDDPFRRAEDWPDAVFTPIRTLADDEVAVKRDDLAEHVAAREAAVEQRGRVAALREAADEAESDAEKCPCHTTRCREANLTTARWLRDRADALEAGEDA